jgi:hypothetical protein
MSKKESIIAKMKKLFSLAKSDNPNEAKVAMERAQDMMIKHNIEMREVKADNTYTSAESDGFKRESMEDKYINSILTNYFYVDIVKGGTRYGEKRFTYVGEASNVEMAMYVRDYLLRTFQTLWKKYKKEHNLQSSSKQSFYLGLFKGFCAKMEEQLAQAVESYGKELVLVKDPKVEEKVQEMFPNASKMPSKKVRNSDPGAYNDGFEKGKKINVNRGVGDGGAKAAISN